jgi:hypothetical protein
VTNLLATVRGWRSQLAYIDGAHRVHARVEDRIRTGKDCGLGRFPSHTLATSAAWLTASLTAAALLAWLQLLTLDGDLAKADPKTLRYRILHTAARLTHGQRRRHLAIPATWPWASAITTAWTRIQALAHALVTSDGTIPRNHEGTSGARGTLGHRPASRACCHTPARNQDLLRGPAATPSSDTAA